MTQRDTHAFRSGVCWLVCAVVSTHALSARAESETELVPVTGAEVQLKSFDDTLGPYGTWVEVAGLGRVWRPSPAFVGDDFQPYASRGHWVYTTAGWTFLSDDSWGWAAFHYGRWWNNSVYGWVWLPGTRWAPAWVDWRYGGGYVGWAPVPPPGLHFGFSERWGTPWSFVPTRFITAASYRAYVAPVARVVALSSVTHAAPVAVIGADAHYSPGPPEAHFRAAEMPLHPVVLAEVSHALPPAAIHAAPVLVPAKGDAVVAHPAETITLEAQAREFSEIRASTPEPVHATEPVAATSPVAPKHRVHLTPMVHSRPGHHVVAHHAHAPAKHAAAAPHAPPRRAAAKKQ